MKNPILVPCVKRKYFDLVTNDEEGTILPSLKKSKEVYSRELPSGPKLFGKKMDLLLSRFEALWKVPVRLGLLLRISTCDCNLVLDVQ